MLNRVRTGVIQIDRSRRHLQLCGGITIIYPHVYNTDAWKLGRYGINDIDVWILLLSDFEWLKFHSSRTKYPPEQKRSWNATIWCEKRWQNIVINDRKMNRLFIYGMWKRGITCGSDIGSDTYFIFSGKQVRRSYVLCVYHDDNLMIIMTHDHKHYHHGRIVIMYAMYYHMTSRSECMHACMHEHNFHLFPRCKCIVFLVSELGYRLMGAAFQVLVQEIYGRFTTGIAWYLLFRTIGPIVLSCWWIARATVNFERRDDRCGGSVRIDIRKYGFSRRGRGRPGTIRSVEITLVVNLLHRAPPRAGQAHDISANQPFIALRSP